MIANQGYGMSPWTEASGRKLQYQVDNKLKGTHVTPWKVKEKQIGQKIHWECQTSALGPPGGKGEGCLRYGYGIDQEAELIQYAIDLGIMKKGGAWISLPDDHNVQGIDKAAAYIKENGLYDDIYGQIKDMLCMS
jgi:recombination protein RecA